MLIFGSIGHLKSELISKAIKCILVLALENIHNTKHTEIFNSTLLINMIQPFYIMLTSIQDSSLRAAGIFIRAVVPDSPAGRCDKLVPGDRILAVNGTSLLGVDYHL